MAPPNPHVLVYVRTAALALSRAVAAAARGSALSLSGSSNTLLLIGIHLLPGHSIYTLS
jgi:hypothetical protein